MAEGSLQSQELVDVPERSRHIEVVAATKEGYPDPRLSLLLDIASKKIDSQHSVLGQLDEKCSVLLGFSLVSVIEMLGFLLLVAVEHPTSEYHEPRWVHFVFPSALLLVVVGSVILLLALRGVTYHLISAPEFCDLCDSKKGYVEVADEVISTSGRAMIRNFLVIRHRRIRMRIAACLIGMGLLFFAVLAAHMFRAHF